MRRYVLDASVAVKWFSAVDEPDLIHALKIRRDFIERKIELLAPELLFVELANVLRFNRRFSEHDVISALRSLWQMEFMRADVSSDILRAAITLAYQHHITLYDSVYVALGRRHGPLITADKKLFNRIKPQTDILLLNSFPLEH